MFDWSKRPAIPQAPHEATSPSLCFQSAQSPRLVFAGIVGPRAVAGEVRATPNNMRDDRSSRTSVDRTAHLPPPDAAQLPRRLEQSRSTPPRAYPMQVEGQLRVREGQQRPEEVCALATVPRPLLDSGGPAANPRARGNMLRLLQQPWQQHADLPDALGGGGGGTDCAVENNTEISHMLSRLWDAVTPTIHAHPTKKPSHSTTSCPNKRRGSHRAFVCGRARGSLCPPTPQDNVPPSIQARHDTTMW